MKTSSHRTSAVCLNTSISMATLNRKMNVKMVIIQVQSNSLIWLRKLESPSKKLQLHSFKLIVKSMSFCRSN